MTKKQPDEITLITEAINAHGIFFKRAVRTTLEAIRGLKIIGEEYPVPYLEGASVDLLVEYRLQSRTFIVPIECKRAYVENKKWIFFEDPEQGTKLMYSFAGETLTALNNADFVPRSAPICIEGLEFDMAKTQGQNKPGSSKAASPDVIWKVAFQSCKGCLGFLGQELTARQKYPKDPMSDFTTFSMVITSAPLAFNELSTQMIDSATGRHIGNMALREVPFVVLRYPFTPSQLAPSRRHLEMMTDQYMTPKERGFLGKEGIIVLNVQHIEKFFDLLKSQYG